MSYKFYIIRRKLKPVGWFSGLSEQWLILNQELPRMIGFGVALENLKEVQGLQKKETPKIYNRQGI